MTMEPFARLEPRDIELLNAACAAVEPNEADGDALWVRSFEDGRQWIVESHLGCFWFQVDDYTGVPDEHGFVPVSERLRRFCATTGLDAVDLALADDSTVVASGAGLCAAIDTMPVSSPAPTPWALHETASAVVSAKSFVDLLGSARTLPAGVRESDAPSPPMWLQIAGDSLGLHVDWADFGVTKATYRVAARHGRGDALVALPHRLLENALRVAPLWNELDEEPIDMTIAVGPVCDVDDDRWAILVTTEAWAMALWLVDPLDERWGIDVDAALERGRGLRDVGRDGSAWTVTSSDHLVRVVLHHGHPDVARVSAPLVTHADESLELLRELSQLNAASNGVRYWFADDVVWAACDVPAFAVEAQLAPAVRAVASSAVQYSPMLAALAVSA